MKNEIAEDIAFMKKYFDDNIILTISRNCESSGMLFHDLVQELIVEEYRYFSVNGFDMTIRSYLMMNIDILLGRV